jgi:hypothetical protein
MRHLTLAAALVFSACCATVGQQPAAPAEAPAPAAPKAEEAKPEAADADAPKAPAPKVEEARPAGPVRLDFVSVRDTKAGGNVNDTRYSEKPDDVAILEKKFENGVVTITGQLGFGKGSAWAGFGFGVNFTREATPVDLGKAETITFHLASPTTRTLRLRIVGTDRAVQSAGCYPIVVQPVTPDMTEYVIPLARFAPEGWCGPNARTIQQTAPEAMGVEIVDTTYQRRPSTFSVGGISVP